MFKDNNKDTGKTPDGAFCENSQRLSAVNYFRKKFLLTFCGIFIIMLSIFHKFLILFLLLTLNR